MEELLVKVICGEIKDLRRRIAVRGIVRRGNEIGIIKVNKYDCFIFPGGGVDDGESLIEALKREMLEEAGFQVNVKEHILTVEYVEVDFVHVNHFYECEITSETTKTQLTDVEIELGIEFEWVNILELYKYYVNLEEDLRYGDVNRMVQRSIRSRGFLLMTKLFREMELYEDMLKLWISMDVEVRIDRPIGYVDKFGNEYPINYGYVSIHSLDGKELDAYVLDDCDESYVGKVIGVIRRFDDIEDKLVVSNKEYSDKEIIEKVSFIEKYFNYKLVR